MTAPIKLVATSELRPPLANRPVPDRPHTHSTGSTGTACLGLRADEWVEVRTLDEIHETLDENGCMDGLPFMAEMVQYCGRRFRVHKSAHKTCDTIEEYAIRRMQDAVHLKGLRCDGEAHAGCQAGCLLFWKEAWLKRTRPAAEGEVDEPLSGRVRAMAGTERQRDTLRHAARVSNDPVTGEERYRCQATELLRATTEVRRRDRWDPRFYLRDLTSGNVRLREFIRYGLLAMVNAFMLQWRGHRYPSVCGLAGTQTPTARLNLQAGALVRVRSKHEIMQTLNAGLRNRGLWFDVEMLPHCGSEQRVLRQVERIVDEKTGRLIRFTQPCVILDGVTCSGKLSMHRLFCPRAIYPYWREIWLERVEEHAENRMPSGEAAPLLERLDPRR